MSNYFGQDFFKVPDGADLFYEVRGDGGLPAILCDGRGCDGFVWKSRQHIARGFPALQYDVLKPAG